MQRRLKICFKKKKKVDKTDQVWKDIRQFVYRKILRNRVLDNLKNEGTVNNFYAKFTMKKNKNYLKNEI